MTQKEPHYQGSVDAGAVRPHFGAVLGFEHIESEENTAVIVLNLRQEHCNLHGTVHGGVIMSLVDAAGLWSGAPRDGSVPAASTASLNCNFLRAARFGPVTSLRAEGQITKRGRSMYFSSIRLYACPSGDLIASGQGVFSVTPHRSSAA